MQSKQLLHFGALYGSLQYIGCVGLIDVINNNVYTRCQINQDRMIFGDFSVNSKPIFFEILQRPFSIQILTAVKNLQNYI